MQENVYVRNVERGSSKCKYANTWAAKRETQTKPIHEWRLKKLATIPSFPWNLVQIPKIPQAKATPWSHKCTNFFNPLDPGNDLWTKIAAYQKPQTYKQRWKVTEIENKIISKGVPSPLNRMKPMTMRRGWRTYKERKKKLSRFSGSVDGGRKKKCTA